MASIDLNIIDRGIQGTVWTPQDTGIQASRLDDVKEQRTDNSGALNSLPTPFARFFVVQEAFRRLTEEKRNPSVHAGLAYTRLVSDCLDVFEILFNKKYHENQWGDNVKVVVKEWNKAEEMKELHDRVPILYNALNSIYDEDIKEDKLFFVILEKDGKEYLLGTSSPMTGFVTPPDMDKLDVSKNNTSSIKFQGSLYESLKIDRKTNGQYFRDILLLENRDKDFKNYMYQLFSGSSLDSRYDYLRDYIRELKNDPDVKNNYSIKTNEVLTLFNSELIINGLKVGYNDETDVNDFFLPTLIKLPYRLNRKNFVGIKYEREVNERTYDYLLPLKSEALSYLDQGLAECVCQVKPYSVVVKFRYKGEEYLKEYSEQDEIRDLSKDNHSVNVGLFPNILSPVDTENNYFKLALAVADNNNGEGEWHTLKIEDTALGFYKKDAVGNYVKINEADAERAQNGVGAPVVRSKQGSGVGALACSTKYYELFNTAFDAMKLTIGTDCGFLLPQWRRAQRTNNSYTYAIDLGTSNTFISRTDNNANDVPEMFAMKESMVSYLHENESNTQYSEVANIEDSMGAPVCNMMKTEFVPPFIDGVDYKFPIRTAICKARNIVEQPKLFDNHNIAFFYEKMMETTFQECKTDVKWEENEDCIKIFIQELLLIIKCDVLQHNGVLNQTSLIWFRPLSFSGNSKRIYERCWKSLAQEILFTSDVTCYTESEAPYYYFKKMDYVRNTDSVMIVDIGGGSTDYVYFNENKPVAASSVHFGCDILWGNGHKEFDNIRANGIYQKYIGSLNWGKNDKLRLLESEMKANKQCSTTDIINFWLSNSKSNDIMDSLHNDYLPLFAYHFTAIMYYVAKMYKFEKFAYPRSVVFSGNGSRYIDNFITEDVALIENIVTAIFSKVYGQVETIHVVMPKTRKESTCYGGLYRSKSAVEAPNLIYHGVDKEYENVGQMNNDPSLQSGLLENYKEMNDLYCSVLDILKRHGVVDNSVDLNLFKNNVKLGYDENLSTHYRSDVKEKYTNDDDVCYDAVFFVPVIDKIFELTTIV